MVSHEDLTIPESLVLLALRDEKGTAEPWAGMVGLALAGGVLAELALEGAVVLGEHRKPAKAPVEAGPESPEDPLLVECWTMIRDQDRTRTAQWWISKLSRIRDLRQRIAVGLCHRGILHESEDRVLLLFKRRAFPTVDPGPERELLEAMRAAIFDEAAPTAQLAAVIALADASSLLRVHFGRRELKDRKERLERIASGSETPEVAAATQAAVQAVQTAVLAATTAATVAATTSS